MFFALNNDHKIYELIERAVQRGFLYHFFFWIVFFFFLVISDSSEASLAAKLTHKALRVFFFILIVYINISYLFPQLLKKNQFLLYFFFLVSVVVVMTPIEVVLHYFLFGEKSSGLASVFTFKNNSIYFLGSFFIAFSASIFKIINDWIQHQKERAELQRQTLKSELKFLKTQINPHFFFNTLNSLYALTLKKSDEAPEVVLKLSEMMRYMLYESNERTIELSKEISYIQNYLELEKIRHGKNVEIKFEIDGEAQGHKIAPLLFITFLENSFKHGLSHELKAGFVHIHLDIQEKGLKFAVRNSKPTTLLNMPVQKRTGGIGLQNVRRRLNILYPSKHKLQIDDSKGEFAVEFEVRGTQRTN